MANDLGLNKNLKERRDKKFDPPPGFSDKSNQEGGNVRSSARPNKNKKLSRFGDTVKHFAFTESETKETHGSRLKEALINYRTNLVNSSTETIERSSQG